MEHVCHSFFADDPTSLSNDNKKNKQEHGVLSKKTALRTSLLCNTATILSDRSHFDQRMTNTNFIPLSLVFHSHQPRRVLILGRSKSANL